MDSTSVLRKNEESTAVGKLARSCSYIGAASAIGFACSRTKAFTEGKKKIKTRDDVESSLTVDIPDYLRMYKKTPVSVLPATCHMC
jgi:hypothetical protein